jgi:hypothetical protein
MKLQPWIALVFTLSLVGCQAPAPTTQPAPTIATADQLERIRATYKQQNPKVDVGVVQDVLPDKSLAAVGDVDVTTFKNGDIVCFVDVNIQPLCCGQVVRITEHQVHVKYEAPGDGHRAPMQGDIAVAFH